MKKTIILSIICFLCFSFSPSTNQVSKNSSEEFSFRYNVGKIPLDEKDYQKLREDGEFYKENPAYTLYFLESVFPPKINPKKRLTLYYLSMRYSPERINYINEGRTSLEDTEAASSNLIFIIIALSMIGIFIMLAFNIYRPPGDKDDRIGNLKLLSGSYILLFFAMLVSLMISSCGGGIPLNGIHKISIFITLGMSVSVIFGTLLGWLGGYLGTSNKIGKVMFIITTALTTVPVAIFGNSLAIEGISYLPIAFWHYIGVYICLMGLILIFRLLVIERFFMKQIGFFLLSVALTATLSFMERKRNLTQKLKRK